MIVLTGQLCTVLCVCIGAIYIQYCITVLATCLGYIHTYIHTYIIRKYRTIGSTGPHTPAVSPFIRGFAVLVPQSWVVKTELLPKVDTDVLKHKLFSSRNDHLKYLTRITVRSVSKRKASNRYT